ncbi:MAG: succinylglutamate desuccinylase/aspartoacylase family protein [Candidatus Omnitrophica bacterium]|nr:succinylglutamate desuccinylase/aspartoacylase family protein [Candidatus Omnitrophota bacterium]
MPKTYLPVFFTQFFLGWSLVSFSSQERFPSVERKFAGLPYQVEIVRLKGQQVGPTLLLIGGIHGDELAGCLALERYAIMTLKRGQMIVIPRLNWAAIMAGKRGVNGVDMNRLFSLPQEKLPQPEGQVVNLVKALVQEASCVVNTHQGSGFFDFRWVDKKRNPARWGQCNVIDAPYFDLPNGEQIRLEEFASWVVERANREIQEERYRFKVNNTETASEQSPHKEQRRSLTYYALTKAHRMAVGIEVTKECSLSEAVSFMTIAINAVMERLGIVPEAFPNIDTGSVEKELKQQTRLTGLTALVSGQKKKFFPGTSIYLRAEEKIKVLELETENPLGWWVCFSDNREENALGKEQPFREGAAIEVWKDRKKYQFPIRLGKRYLAGVEVAVGANVHAYQLGETIFWPADQTFKVLRVLPESQNSITVDIKGFVGNRKKNDGQDAGYEVKASRLIPSFALDEQKTLYRIEIREKNELVGELFLKLTN